MVDVIANLERHMNAQVDKLETELATARQRIAELEPLRDGVGNLVKQLVAAKETRDALQARLTALEEYVREHAREFWPSYQNGVTYPPRVAAAQLQERIADLENELIQLRTALAIATKTTEEETRL